MTKDNKKEIENIVEYNGEWHKKGKDGNCEKFIMADLEELIAQAQRDILSEVEHFADNNMTNVGDRISPQNVIEEDDLKSLLSQKRKELE